MRGSMQHPPPKADPVNLVLSSSPVAHCAASFGIGLRAAIACAQAFEPQHGKTSSAASPARNSFHRIKTLVIPSFRARLAAPEILPPDSPRPLRDIAPWIAYRQSAELPRPQPFWLTAQALTLCVFPSRSAPSRSDEAARALRFPSPDECLPQLHLQAVPTPRGIPWRSLARCGPPLFAPAHNTLKLTLPHHLPQHLPPVPPPSPPHPTQ